VAIGALQRAAFSGALGLLASPVGVSERVRPHAVRVDADGAFRLTESSLKLLLATREGAHCGRELACACVLVRSRVDETPRYIHFPSCGVWLLFDCELRSFQYLEELASS
jgi:hypothetical protein